MPPPSASAPPTPPSKPGPGAALVITAGAMAGALEVAITYPLEFVKTQLQLSREFTSSADVVRRTVRSHGVRGLYRGVASNLAFSLPRVALRFFVYEAAVRALHGGGGGAFSPGAIFAAGALAGVAEAAAVIVPMTTLQVRLVSDRNSPAPRFAGMADAVRQIAAVEGVRGFYRAAGPTVLKITFNISFRFLFFDLLTERLAGLAGGRAAGAAPSALRDNAVALAAGGLAGALTVLANQPLDVVKSRLQADDGAAYGGSATRCARMLYAGGGARAFYAGLAPRLNRVVLETALTFVFYQNLLAALPPLAPGLFLTKQQQAEF
jgi:solute carrier family 25 citrate transporter 1